MFIIPFDKIIQHSNDGSRCKSGLPAQKEKTRIAKLNVLNDTNIYTGYDSLPLQRQLYYKVTLSQENV